MIETVKRCGRIHVVNGGVESAEFVELTSSGEFGVFVPYLVRLTETAEMAAADIARNMDIWYTIPQAAQRLVQLGKCTTPPHPKTMCRWARAGRFPGAVKVPGRGGRGGEWRISRSALWAFPERRKRK